MYKMEHMASHFTYPALPKGSIRLLRISFDERNNLSLKMNVYPLSELPDFNALSYTWGTSRAKTAVLCNGSYFEIASNLHEAISTFHNPPVRLEQLIWIDAICINQQDNEEKGEQVRCMGDIYTKATQVVVWLGLAGNDSDVALEWMVRLSSLLPPIPNPPMLDSLPEHGLPEKGSPLWPALGHFYRRNWFGRLWTFQEAVLAQEKLLVCGTKTVKWETAALVAKKLLRLMIWTLCVGYERPELHRDGFRAMQSIDFSRMVLKEYRPLNFATLLMMADTKLVTEPRDRVYGMLGMALADVRDRIPISYENAGNAGDLQAYIDCAKACVEGEPVMKLLLLQIVAGRPRVPGLPSWVPNLNYSQGKILPFGEHVLAGILPDREAIGEIRTIPGSNVLKVRGFRAGSILEIGEGSFQWPLAKDEEQIPRAQGFLKWEETCLQIAKRVYPPGSSADSIPMGHLFTLTSNTRTRIREGQDEEFLQSYHDVLANIRQNAKDGQTHHPPHQRRAMYHSTWQQIYYACPGRRYFATSDGRTGLGPPDMHVGDEVCVLYDAPALFILQRREGGGWTLIGDAYVYGLMDLEETLKQSRMEDEVFDIF